MYSSWSSEWPSSDAEPAKLANNLLADNYLVVLDTSGSMNKKECSGWETKFTVAREALKSFAAQIPASANLAMAVFHELSARMVVPFGHGANHRAAFNQMVDNLAADGGTPLNGAITFAYAALTEQGRRQTGYGSYRLIVITDGVSGDGTPAPLAREIVEQSPVELHVIGFCTGPDHSLNLPGVTRYYTADNPEQLAEGLKAVQAETPDFTVTQFQ
ncbi:putative von Willebrand factor type A (vWA) domain-containing protein [Magnetofaba australis IT-1]|uniref:Putative von Willebrand factor type A (VWA) domain-containing protein n=2 Tax=Magnetofaba TaxID=1472292 RepID=A0A1Y2K1R0_9PROT|nr:putative von Willebrand factor type A (vWA) domain-containing protein [Magnetofaba australis IT-1]